MKRAHFPHALAAILLATLVSPAARAATLKPETLTAWQEYVKAAGAGMQDRLTPGRDFLLSNDSPDCRERLRNGEIIVSPAAPHIPKRIPSGLIHDWVGDAFIPNATLEDVLHVIRDYNGYKQTYHPGVGESKAISTNETEDRAFMLLVNKSVVSKTALECTYRCAYFRIDGQRLYSVTETTRIQEIRNYGNAGQQTLPEDQGTGLIWRIYSFTRFEQRDGGVYIEAEPMVLSRDVPFSLRWMIDPIVRRVSRDSVLTSLRQTREAVCSGAKIRNGLIKESLTSRR